MQERQFSTKPFTQNSVILKILPQVSVHLKSFPWLVKPKPMFYISVFLLLKFASLNETSIAERLKIRATLQDVVLSPCCTTSALYTISLVIVSTVVQRRALYSELAYFTYYVLLPLIQLTTLCRRVILSNVLYHPWLKLG